MLVLFDTRNLQAEDVQDVLTRPEARSEALLDPGLELQLQVCALKTVAKSTHDAAHDHLFSNTHGFRCMHARLINHVFCRWRRRI
jgi:hypothetical protein